MKSPSFGGGVGAVADPAASPLDSGGAAASDDSGIIDDDDFGDFEGTVPSGPTPVAAGTAEPVTGSTEGSWGAFDSLVDVQDAPLSASSFEAPVQQQPIGESKPATVADPDEHGDGNDFGGFVGSGDEPVDDVKQNETSEGAWGAFDALTDVQDATLPVLSFEEPSQPPATESKQDTGGNGGGDSDDDFGGFVGSDDEPMADLKQKETVEKGAWGAFDALADVQDAPLPVLSFEEPSQPPATESKTGTGGNGGGDSDDDFGGFVGSDDEPMADLKQKETAEKGAWGAFDALADVQDAPLPVLSFEEPAQSPASKSKQATDGGDDGDKDDFGVVVGSVAEPAADLKHNESEEGACSAFDALAEVQDAPLPIHSFEKAPPNSGVKSEAVGDEKSGAATSADAEVVSEFPPNTEPVNNESGWGAFGALANVQDAPLPTLDEHTFGQHADPPINDDEDDFGDFVGTDEEGPISADGLDRVTPSEDVAPTVTATLEADDFGDFEGIETAEAAPGSSSAGHVQGASLAPQPAEDPTGISGSDNGWNALEALRGGSADAPLPSLDALFFDQPGVSEKSEEATPFGPNIGHEETQDISDGFGDFVGGESASIKEGEAVEDLAAQSVQNPVEMERVDTDYFSADDLKPTSSGDSEDFIGFEDAVESLGGGDVNGESQPTAVSEETGRGDLFSGFDSALPSPAVSRPSDERTREETDDFGDFEGIVKSDEGGVDPAAAVASSLPDWSNG